MAQHREKHTASPNGPRPRRTPQGRPGKSPDTPDLPREFDIERGAGLILCPIRRCSVVKGVLF